MPYCEGWFATAWVARGIGRDPTSCSPPMPASPLIAWALTLVPALTALPAETAETRPFQVMAVAGAHSGDAGVHPYLGVEGGWHPGLLGARGTAMYGRGNDFSSVLAGGGPALRQPLGDWLALVAWGGGGWYREGRAPGLSRSLPVVLGGAALEFPVGSFIVSAGGTAFVGTYSSRDAPVSHRIRSVRLTLGLGR